MQLTTIASFASYLEAELAKGLLEANGIVAFLGDEYVGRIANHLTPMTGGIKIQVADADVAAAVEVLSKVGRSPKPDEPGP